MIKNTVLNSKLKININNKFKNYLSFENEVANIYLYNEIVSEEWDENSPTSILFQLNGYTNLKTINLYINSPGGDVASGFAICNIINRKRETGVVCNVYIDGFACSIASIIALSVADKLYMYDNSLIMIHLPSCMAYGNKEDFKKAIKDLEEVESRLKAMYKLIAKDTLTDELLDKAMSEETWFNADDIEMYFNIDIEKKSTIYNKTLLSVEGYKQFKNLSEDKLKFLDKYYANKVLKSIAISKLEEISKYLNI